MNRKKIGLLATFVAILLAAAAFFTLQGKSEKASDKIQAVATFYPVYEFAKAVLGEQGEVELLIKAGTEVHDFEPSTKNLSTIQEADVFVYADDKMETWVPSLTKAIDTDQVTVIEMTSAVLSTATSEEEEHEEEDHHHAYDPHLWLSPSRAISLIDRIRCDLAKAYPDKAELFEKNADAYIEKLKALDAKYTEVLLAAKQKSFVTQHAAFGYLALDYGLNQLSITGLSAESEPTAQGLAELTAYVKEEGINYIYFEENASALVSETLAKEAGVKTAVLNPLESLTKAQMEAGEDYFSVMEANLAALQLTAYP